MKSILEIPADVISQFTAVPEEFWLRVSNYLFARALEHAHDHLLVRTHRRFDFSVVVKKCQAYRLYAGQRGQEADFSLEQLCRALVVRYLNHWSLRQTCEEIKSNLLLRWFVGFLLNEQTPSYVTMQRFEEWVKVHRAASLLQRDTAPNRPGLSRRRRPSPGGRHLCLAGAHDAAEPHPNVAQRRSQSALLPGTGGASSPVYPLTCALPDPLARDDPDPRGAFWPARCATRTVADQGRAR